MHWIMRNLNLFDWPCSCNELRRTHRYCEKGILNILNITTLKKTPGSAWSGKGSIGAKTPFRVKDDREIGQLSTDLTNNGVRLTQLWVTFRVKLTDFRVIVDPEWSSAAMDPFRVNFWPGCFRVYDYWAYYCFIRQETQTLHDNYMTTKDTAITRRRRTGKDSLKVVDPILQISLNITNLWNDEKYTSVIMNMKSYSCRLYNFQIRDKNLK